MLSGSLKFEGLNIHPFVFNLRPLAKMLASLWTTQRVDLKICQALICDQIVII